MGKNYQITTNAGDKNNYFLFVLMVGGNGVHMRNIDLKSGNVIYNEFNISFNMPLSEQLESLTEDLIQIEYDNGYLIDIGWYPEYDEEGNFIVQLIKDYNWENPIYKQGCKDDKQLKKILLKAIEKIGCV